MIPPKIVNVKRIFRISIFFASYTVIVFRAPNITKAYPIPAILIKNWISPYLSEASNDAKYSQKILPIPLAIMSAIPIEPTSLIIFNIRIFFHYFITLT